MAWVVGLRGAKAIKRGGFSLPLTASFCCDASGSSFWSFYSWSCFCGAIQSYSPCFVTGIYDDHIKATCAGFHQSGLVERNVTNSLGSDLALWARNNLVTMQHITYLGVEVSGSNIDSGQHCFIYFKILIYYDTYIPIETIRIYGVSQAAE